MSGRFSEEKLIARRAVHEQFAVPAVYYEVTPGPGRGLRARLHTKIARGGDIGGGYAEVVEGITRAVFNREELALQRITLRRNGLVLFPGNVRVTLDIRDPYEGPLNESWTVTPA